MVERTPGRPAGNLPVAVTSFVGRRREIAEVRRRLSAARLVTLTGVGGVGKTRLAIEVAAESRRAFAGGTWLVDLAPVRDAALVARTVAAALGLADQSAKAAEEQLADHLANRQVLIVLDNCEHLVDACATFVDRALRALPDLHILATSRQVLGISGEHLFTVPPLSVPDPDSPPPAEALTRYESVDLLLDRVTAVRPGFRLTEDNRDTVARLCAQLDGLPLAIELAASRLRALPIEQVVTRLADRFALLTGGSRAALPRQRTLRALIDWSYELCTPREKRLWQRLSVFAGGFDLEAAEGVCADEDLPAEAILDLVDQLVAQSVVLVAEQDGRPRYRMLETIREYGCQRLVESGEHHLLRDRHRDFFLGLAERIAEVWCGPGQEAGLARLRAEHGNLRAALEWSTTDPGSEQAALALSAALCFHWCADGFLSEGRRWLDRALALTGEPTAARTDALWVAAWVMLLQGDHTAAEQRLAECEALARRFARPRALGYVVSLRGTSALFRGRLPEAVTHFEQAVAEFSGLADDAGVLLSLFQLTMAKAHAGDEWAPEAAERAVAISEERGERWTRSYALWSLGFDSWLRGELASALALTRAGLLIQRGFRDHVGSALMIELLAWIAASRSEFRRAGVLLGAIRSIWRTIGTTISAFGPHLADHHARCERAVVRALRADAFTAALAEGGRLDQEHAVAYALEERPAPPPGAPTPTDAVLTKREREVAELVARGMSNRKIASALVLSPRTVDGHVEHILTKLGFTSRTQVAAWVAGQGSAHPAG